MTSAATQDRQEQIRSAIRKGNEFTVEKIRAVAGAVPSVKIPTPKIPTPKIPQSMFDVPKFREEAMAYARRLPAPADVVESAFGLADRLSDEVKKATAALRPTFDLSGVVETTEGVATAETAETDQAAEVVTTGEVVSEAPAAPEADEVSKARKARKSRKADDTAEKTDNE